jgi:hypothetical protein
MFGFELRPTIIAAREKPIFSRVSRATPTLLARKV